MVVSPASSFPGSQQARAFILLSLCLLSLTFVFAVGCGSGGSTPKITNQAAPSITSQPGNQSTRVGQTATFTVVAAGTGPLSYQWSKNQTAITGATSASFTTPTAAPTDNGAVFSVTVTNSVGSVSSNPATLTVGPRAPAAGDLRFQQVAAASTLPGLIPGGIHSDVFAGLMQGFGNSIGTPLTLGANCNSGTGSSLNCAWAFSTFPLPNGVTSLTTDYEGFDSTVFPLDTQLQSLVNGHNVFTSLDLELSNDCYSAAWIETSSGGGFVYSQQSVSPTQLQAVATLLAGQGTVITAVSFDASGNAFFTAYSWMSDTTTIYDVKVLTATFSTIAAQATSLAGAGYIITAVGGNPTNGFLLVGTRVQGDTMPRPILIVTPKTGTDLDPLLQSGDSIVGYIVNPDFSNTYIGEQ